MTTKRPGEPGTSSIEEVARRRDVVEARRPVDRRRILAARRGGPRGTARSRRRTPESPRNGRTRGCRPARRRRASRTSRARSASAGSRRCCTPTTEKGGSAPASKAGGRPGHIGHARAFEVDQRAQLRDQARRPAAGGNDDLLARRLTAHRPGAQPGASPHGRDARPGRPPGTQPPLAPRAAAWPAGPRVARTNPAPGSRFALSARRNCGKRARSAARSSRSTVAPEQLAVPRLLFEAMVVGLGRHDEVAESYEQLLLGLALQGHPGLDRSDAQPRVLGIAIRRLDLARGAVRGGVVGRNPRPIDQR